VARLGPGNTLESAQAEAAVLQSRWEAEFTDWAVAVYGTTYRLQVRPEFHLAPFEARGLRRMLFFLWFVVGAVFLIGCTNLANLLLASGAGREQEMGIRSSLGANQWRLLAQLLTESLVLAILGGVAGLGVAYMGAGAISAALPMNFEAGFQPDGSVIAFTFLLAAAAAVLFGTAPAWKLSRIDVRTLIQRPGQARTRALFRGGLVAGQSALSILLLIGGGLLARSVQQIQRIDLGFDPDRKLLMSLQLDNHGYSEEDGQAFVLGALDRLDQVPGVTSASVSNRVPFLGSNTFTITAPGTDFAEQGLLLGLNLVGPDYLETMEIPLVAGREFTKDDIAGTPWVAVVNQALAQRLWPNENPLGKTVDILGQEARVVGVAETSVYYNVTESPRPHIYFPSLQFYSGMMSFVVATEPPTTTMVGPVDQALRELNPNLAIAPMTLEGLVETQVGAFRTWTTVVGIFAAIALFLALVGLYGVQSYLVSRRTKEIGLRMALGAPAQTVVGGVVKNALVMGGIGALLGVGSALVLSRLMRSFLFGVGPNDPLVFVTVPLLLLLACVAASLVPALRASSVNPVEALRRE
jgi:predicted permease